MVKRLSEQGLLEHVPYKGVQLTADGRRAALRMLRRHRLIEAYLVAFLGYTWDTVHDEAERLEHAVSDTLVERMAAVLGNPTVDPHGDPIPTPEGDIHELASIPALRGAGRRPRSRSGRWRRASPTGCATSPRWGSGPGCRSPWWTGSRSTGRSPSRWAGQTHVIGNELGQVVRCASDEDA